MSAAVVKHLVTHLCTNPECRGGEWQVTADDQFRDLWHLRGVRGAFTLASHDAVCPLCSTALVRIDKLIPELEAWLSVETAGRNS